MAIVSGVIVDATGKKDSREWKVWSPVYAESATGDVVSTRVRTINVTAGVFHASIDPGVVVLENPDGKRWTVTIPESPIDLWDLIELSVALPPDTPADVIADVVGQWLEDNPPATGGETDLTVSRTSTSVTVQSSTGTDAVVPAADGSNAGAMTAAMQTKLAGIATAATANATDAALRDRSTHTGQQPSTSISDFTEAVQDAVAALLAQGTNVTLTYDDAGNVLTIAASSGSGLDAEGVRDAIGVALLGSGNVSVTVNDAADTITISTTATVNSTDAALRDRSTHTGTQSADTITDGTTNKAFTATEKTKLSGIATGATAYTNTDADGRISAAIGTTVQGYNASTTHLGNTTTGTGVIVQATSPTLVTPALGTPTSGNLANCTFPTLNQSTSGNAATATKLATPRNINGVAFDGSADITISAAAPSVATATVATSETTTSTTYTDLATTTDTITVTVGASGIVQVAVTAWMKASTVDADAFVSFAVSGANTLAADDRRCTGMSTPSGGGHQSTGVVLLTGLTAGSTTFTMKYRVSGSTGTFFNRTISAIAF